MGFIKYISTLLSKLEKNKTIPNFKLCSLFLCDIFKHQKSKTSLISTSRLAFTSIAFHTLSSKSHKQCQETENHYAHEITKGTDIETTDYFRSLFKCLFQIGRYLNCGVSFGQSDVINKVTFDNILNGLSKEKGWFTSLSEKNCSIIQQASDYKRTLHHLCIWPSISNTFLSNFKDLKNSTTIKYIKCLKDPGKNFQKFSTMEKASNHLVFVYGTLKRGEPNHDVITQKTEGKSVFMGKAATLKRWPLVIASRYNIPYLLYSEGKGENVVGEVYKVDNTMLAKFDEFESHPNYYTRLTEEVQLFSENDPEKKLIKPWIYFLKNFRPQLLNLPCLSDYSSKGSHGLEYVSSEETSNPEDVYT